MSFDLFVYLERQSMPSPEAWRDAIVAAGFPVELHSNFDVETMSGFLPAPVNGELSGFEYFVRAMSQEEIQESRLAGQANFSVTFAIRSMNLELVSAAAAAAVLAKLTGGWLVDPQEGRSYSCDEAIQWAQEQIASVRIG